jgi:hypothetical protein
VEVIRAASSAAAADTQRRGRNVRRTTTAIAVS